MDERTSGNSRSKLFVFLLISAFFGPYYPGTPLRLDQVVGWIYIVALLVFLVVNGRIRIPMRSEKYVIGLSFVILFFMTIRLFLDVKIYRDAFQMTNQFSYFCAGASIFCLHRERLLRSTNFIIRTLLSMAILVNLFAFFQFINPQHEVVSTALRWYGGVGQEEYEYDDFNTLAAKTLLGGGQSISIFSGVQALAIFNLFIIAMAYGTLSDSLSKSGMKFLGLLSLILALIGGVLSGSKTFVFGVILLFVLISVGGMRISRIGYALFLFVMFFAIFYLFSSQLRVTGDVWDLMIGGGIWDIFGSRFGSSDYEGYLSDVMAKTIEPFTLIFGLGTLAFDYKYTDFQFRQIVLVGGLPLFLLFYGLLVYLLVLNWRSRRSSSYGLPLFALGLVFLIAGVGQDVHLQARIVPLWMITNLLVGLGRRAATHKWVEPRPRVRDAVGVGAHSARLQG